MIYHFETPKLPGNSGAGKTALIFFFLAVVTGACIYYAEHKEQEENKYRFKAK